MHHLLQEANYSHLQFYVQLKVLRKHTRKTTLLLHGSYYTALETEGIKKRGQSSPESVWTPSDAAHSGLYLWPLCE